jgi:hypothetical protein
MMGQLERRAEAISGEFNSQAVANTLWATCFFSLRFEGFFRVCWSLCHCLPIDMDDENHLRQMHQFFITCDLQEGLHAALPARLLALKGKCRAAFIGGSVQPSASQQQVSDTLRDMGLSVEDEFRCPKSGYSIDMRVHDTRVSANSSTGASEGWAVEFDGPSHFLACRSPLGGTLMKRWHLELLGHTLVSLPFWEWDRLTGSDERKEYLRAKLHISRDLE